MSGELDILEGVEFLESQKDKKLLSLLNLEDLYNRSEGAICVNEVPSDVESFNDYITKQLFFDMSGQLDFTASCMCGYLVGNFNMGLVCPNCGQVVRSEFINMISHKNWIGIPSTMPKVMHPIVYLVLKNYLGRMNHIPLINYLLDPSLDLPPSLATHIKGQGYRYFYKNYDQIMEFFFTKFPKTTIKNDKHDGLFRQFFEKYKWLTFTSKLAILDPALHPVSYHGSGKLLIDKLAIPMLNAVNSLTYSYYEIRKSITAKNYADKILYKVYTSYMQYIEELIAYKLGSKPGFLRKQAYGVRAHWSWRAVIIPNIDCDYADELKIPWSIGVNTLKLHILGFLRRKYGYTWPDAIMKVKSALIRYDPEINEIMKYILENYYEDVHKDLVDEYVRVIGLRCLHDRNPTLQHGSIYLLRVVIIKPDPDDQTQELPTLIVKPPNADYDGDETNCVALFEKARWKNYETVHPKELMLSKNSLKVDSAIGITAPALITINAYLSEEEDYLESIGFVYPEESVYAY